MRDPILIVRARRQSTKFKLKIDATMEKSYEVNSRTVGQLFVVGQRYRNIRPQRIDTGGLYYMPKASKESDIFLFHKSYIPLIEGITCIRIVTEPYGSNKQINRVQYMWLELVSLGLIKIALSAMSCDNYL